MLERGRLIGRDREVAVLAAALDEAAGGAMAAVALAGEPGIGKTRMLAELRMMAAERGYVVVHAAASELEAYVPYAVAIAALDPYLGSPAGTGSAPAELAAIFPSLAPGPGPGGSETSAGERWRVHRSIREAIGRMAERSPLVIVLDDLHWCDEASLELIEALLRRPVDAPVLLALAYRDGQAPERLTAATRAPGVEYLPLEPLSIADATELLAIEPGAGSVAALYEQVGGNPFYLSQLARRPDPDTVPDGIVATIAAEVAVLDPAARRLAESAAVAGEPFAADLAIEVAGLSESDGLTGLDELLGSDLVRTTEAPRSFAFRHPIVRRAVYEGAPAGWRLAAHGRAAAALERRGAQAVAIAPHVEQSAAEGDEAAIALLLRAGEESAARAPATAGRCFEAALRLIPATDGARQVAVREKLADALRAAGDLGRARRVLLEAIDLLPDHSDPRWIDLTTRCAAVERWLGRSDDARRRLLRASEIVPGDAPGATGILIELAVGAVYDRDLEAAVATGARALAGARRQGTAAEVAAAAAALSLAEAVAGRIGEARANRLEAVEFVDAASDDELIGQIDVLYHLAWAENYLEHYDAALGHVDRMIGALRRVDGARPLVPLMLLRCYPLETLGRLEEAAGVAADALEASQLGGDSRFRAWALFEHAWASYYRGELGTAVASAEESMRLSERPIGGAGPSAGIGPAWVLACALIESGEHDRARELLHPLAGEEIEGAMPVERAFFWETLALAELDGGDVALARAYTERAEQDAAALDLALPRGVAQRSRAALSLAAGDARRAAREAAASAESLGTIGARIEVAFSRHLQGRAAAAAGDRKEAIRILRDAETELDACGSTRERDAARRELRRLGARAEVRGPGATGGGIDSLTGRERQIAELVERRLTNREIADQLVLSEKTIESHLRNVFAKLGASSRVEVARLLEGRRTD
ncbi:MAG: DUF2791 family P-loop domain-containing protein [Solirubrobacterales bacterium]